MRELAKEVSNELYPDLERAGGLPQALQPVLAKLPGDLVVTELEGLPEAFLVNARVSSGTRFSQVSIAAEHRAFSADFWSQGVQYGGGWAKSLDEVAAAIHAFQQEQIDAATLKARHSWVDVDERAFVHQRGPTAFVEVAWQDLLDWLSKEPPQSCQRLLLPLIRACMARPRLHMLMPFTSMDRLCFSRTTGFPYTSECPLAFPLRDGGFRMEKASAKGTSLDGDAEAIAVALEATLSTAYSGAVHGTADDVGGAT